jgi:DNA-binding NarL/FixJ family response regulator/uncharacterized protein involved in exopolysaccharide biosynthesis
MIRILIVEDQRTILQLLKSYLEQEPNMKIVAIAAHGQLAIEKVEKLRPDVVLMDVEMPGIDGISATRIISQRYPKTKVLILTTHDNNQVINMAKAAGAKGYLLKTAPVKELIEFIIAVHDDKFQFKTDLVKKSQPESEILSIPSQQTFTVTATTTTTSSSKFPYFLAGVLLNLAVWLLVVVYWKITPPKYTSEWGMKLLQIEAGVELNLPDIGRASSNDSSDQSRQDPRTDYVYIATDHVIVEKAAEKMGLSAVDFGNPEITIDETSSVISLAKDSSIISLAIEGNTPLEAQQKAYTFHQVLIEEVENLRQAELKRQEQETQATLAQARQKLDQAQERLSTYQASSSLGAEEQIGNLASNLEQLRLQQAELSADEQGLNNRSQYLGQELKLSSTEATAAYQLLEDDVYQAQLQQYARAKAELASLLSNFTSENPSVINKQAELEEATTALQQRANFLLNRPVTREELEQITYLTLNPQVTTVQQDVFKDLITNQADRQKLAAQIQELEKQTVQIEGRQRNIAQEKLKIDRLQRDLQVAEAIFANTLAKLDLGKETVYSIYPPVQLIKQPSLPEENKPTTPNLRLLLLAGMAGSFLITTGLILVWFERQPSQLIRPKTLRQISPNDLFSKINKYK